MNKFLSPKFAFLLLVVLAGFSASAIAQVEPAPDANRPPFERGPRERRPNLFRALGLSPEQVQEIRKLNQERKPQMDAALVRLRDANRALDEAIYSDRFDESIFQARLKDHHLAQAEVARLRFQGELSVRKVLTAEQLAKFRELRMRSGPRPDRDGPPPDDKMHPGQPFRGGRRPAI